MDAKMKISLGVALTLVLAVPSIGAAKNKGQRGMLESMQSVPCGAKERGLTGLGSMWASLGVEHVNSHEQLCPQYLLRTDQMDYHIRPTDTKHAVVLPVGQEAEFRIKKDRLFLKVVDTKDKKERAYQVVSMQPASSTAGNSAYRPMEKPPESRPADFTSSKGATPQTIDRPPQY